MRRLTVEMRKSVSGCCALLLAVPFGGVLVVEILGIVPIDMAITRARGSVDGALALLEAGGGHLGGILMGRRCQSWYTAGTARKVEVDSPHSSVLRRLSEGEAERRLSSWPVCVC